MNKNKKIIGLICTITLAIGNTMPALACTPQFQAPKLPNFSDFQWEPSEELKEQLNNAVDVYIEEKTLETPEITDARYVHAGWFWDHNRLQITWKEVPDATSYDIKITEPDGTEETYTSESVSLYVPDIGCMKQKIDGNWKSAKVQVRAIGEGGKSSCWSEKENVSCNMFHF